mgnify:FL=1
MSIGLILVDVLIMMVATVVAMWLIGAFARRVLGTRVGIIRILLAGVVGLGAGIGFESRFVWGVANYNAALIPVQVGIILFVAVAFLVVAEVFVPQGTVARPDEWVVGARHRTERTRRYRELARIALRHKLVPFKLNTQPTSAGAAERTRQAQALRGALEDAGGAFVKLGQILSTRTDVLPIEFTTALSTLQQNVPPVPWAEIAVALEAELGRPLNTVFKNIDEHPLAAASIGQMHVATLLSGEKVAVKVQRPGIDRLVERDIDITRRIASRLTESAAWARQFGIGELAESLSLSLMDELDYRLEASNIAAMEFTQAQHAPADRVRIPHRFVSLCTQRVLVMEFIEGTTLSDPTATANLDEATRGALATQLFHSALTQIMDDGVFHSDLHPGNVMLTPSDELALIDFGSVGRLDSEVRGQITDVLLAFSQSDSRAFADALLAFVELPDDLDEFALRRQIGEFMARFLGPGAVIDVSAFTQMILVLTNNQLAVPSELTAAFRAMATLEGTLRVLSPGFDFVAEASQYASVRIAHAQRPSAVAKAVKTELARMIPLARRLPYRIDQITGDLADGRLSVNVRLFADRRDRALLRDFGNLASLTFLAGVFGIMAAMLLTSTDGPLVTDSISLFQLFGYLLVIASGVLTLRVFFDIFRRQERRRD